MRLSAPLAVHFSSKNSEHCTPAAILSRVVACLGAIDLDPCSNSRETPHTPATTHFTRADDGLSRAWHGRVFMNPPYGREIAAWAEKLVREYQQGNVTEAIALVPARTDTQWWQRFNDYHVCFVVGRLTFVGNGDPAPFPSAVIYLGRDVGKFIASFEEIGPIWHVARRNANHVHRWAIRAVRQMKGDGAAHADAVSQ